MHWQSTCGSPLLQQIINTTLHSLSFLRYPAIILWIQLLLQLWFALGCPSPSIGFQFAHSLALVSPSCIRVAWELHCLALDGELGSNLGMECGIVDGIYIWGSHWHSPCLTTHP